MQIKSSILHKYNRMDLRIHHCRRHSSDSPDRMGVTTRFLRGLRDSSALHRPPAQASAPRGESMRSSQLEL